MNATNTTRTTTMDTAKKTTTKLLLGALTLPLLVLGLSACDLPFVPPGEPTPAHPFLDQYSANPDTVPPPPPPPVTGSRN